MLTTVKKYDYYVQLALLITWFVLFIKFFFGNPFEETIHFFTGYYFVGGFQLCSICFWLIVGFKKLNSVRIIYCTLFFILCIGIFGYGFRFEEDAFFFSGLIVPPFLSIFYLILTHQEWQEMKIK